jgi:hypothetical protein
MKKIALLFALIAVPATAGAASAQDVHMPYFGISPYDGSYWNGPDYDYDVGPKGGTQSNVIPNNAEQSYAQAPAVHHRHRAVRNPGS